MIGLCCIPVYLWLLIYLDSWATPFHCASCTGRIVDPSCGWFCWLKELWGWCRRPIERRSFPWSDYVERSSRQAGGGWTRWRPGTLWFRGTRVWALDVVHRGPEGGAKAAGIHWSWISCSQVVGWRRWHVLSWWVHSKKLLWCPSFRPPYPW